MNSHIVETHSNGELVAPSELELRRRVQSIMQNDRAVLHFHGGLVEARAGRVIADTLKPSYDEAGAESLFFVWHSDAPGVVVGNVEGILKDALFNVILRHLLRWTVGKLSDSSGRAPGMDAPPVGVVKSALQARNLADPDQGLEPYANVSVDDSEVAQVRDDELAALRRDLDRDPEVRDLLGQLLDEQQAAEAGPAGGGRGPAGAASEHGLVPMDDDVLAAVRLENSGEGRGFITTAALARQGLKVLRAVVTRFQDKTANGLYCTVVEETLRAFYLSAAGATVWHAMKEVTQRSFDHGRAGQIVIETMLQEYANGSTTRVTLVGHSTGAVFIDKFVRHVVDQRMAGATWPDSSPVQVVLLAPASTSRHFAESWTDVADLVGRVRLFTMTDKAEVDDRVLGALYPRSLLYLVSAILERDAESVSAFVPLTGLARYHGVDSSPYAKSSAGSAARLPEMQSYFSSQDRLVLSPSPSDAVPGSRAEARTHTAFDEDAAIMESIQHLIKTWGSED